MANTIDGKIFRIFIASPGDLSDERQAARRIIERVNRVLAGSKINWRIELLAWEDTLPGFARPQEIINQEVDICNLFVGLLWKRWGQPTGKFSSGFEEEYYRARDRRTVSKEPEIWIFLKRVEKDQFEDPGEQLQKTLGFRQKLQESREALYKEFINTDEWEKTFYDLLLQHIFKNIIPSFSAQPETPQFPSSVPTSELSTDLDKRDAVVIDLPEELDQAIAKMIKAIKQNGLIEKVHISRLYLTSFSLISYFTTEVLGTHEINLIYLFRKEYQLLDGERSLILRSAIADQFNYCPSWYWLGNPDIFDYKSKLAFQAMFDNNLIVRRKSLEFLAINKISDLSMDFPREDFLTRILDQNNSKDMISTALNYLSITGRVDEVSLLEQFVGKPESENYDQALIAYISILARDNVDTAFKLVLKKIGLNADGWMGIFDFEDEKSSIDKNLLMEGLHHQNKNVRLFVISELYRRDAVSSELAKTLKNDDWIPIREVAFRTLISHKEAIESSEIKDSLKETTSKLDPVLYPGFGSRSNPPVNGEDVLFELFNTYSKEKLNQLIYNFLSDGHIAYKAFAHKYFDEMSDRILSDLEAGLGVLLQKLVERVREQFGDSANDLADQIQGSLREYILNKYVISAFSVIAEHDDVRFLEMARTYLESEDNMVKYYSLRILSKLGNEKDVESIVQIAKQSYVGGVKILAAKTALALSTNQIETLEHFLSSKDTDLIKASFGTLMAQEKDSIEKTLRPLLDSDHDITRLSVVYYFINKFNKDALIDLLENYIAKDYYFYDVVCWLDRALYSPEDLRSNFMDQLEKKLS